MNTMGECDVLIKHKEFQCLSPVIIAVDLAHDCLIGMNLLVMWPTMRDAIHVLIKARLSDEKKNSRFEPDSTATRLNNICLPRILSNFDFGMLSNVDTKHTNEVQAIEYHTEMNVAVEPSSDTKTAEIHEDDCESADEIDEDEFKGKFLPEKHMQELAVNFVSIRNPEVREEELVADLDQDFPNVESMIKSAFPQLLAEENSQVGLALKCVHEINLKPGTKPIKQKVR